MSWSMILILSLIRYGDASNGFISQRMYQAVYFIL
jgi:hypothetical protein